MREITVTYYEAFDGKQFNIKEECEAYESNHPFFNPKAIKFYSMNGKKISDPCESVFIDSNRFRVFNEEALTCYQDFCRRMGMKVPPNPNIEQQWPFHYVFEDGRWHCVEHEAQYWINKLAVDFLPEYEDNEEDLHNLVDNSFYEEN